MAQPPFTVQPHPAPSQPPHTTRFVLISDTHGRPPSLAQMPPGDVLIHTGDLSRWGRVEMVEEAVEWLRALRYEVKLIIAGNHDSALDPTLPRYLQPSPASQVAHARSLLTSPLARKAGIHYLEYSPTTFRIRSGRRWTVWGSPGSPAHGSPAFQYSEEEAPVVYKDVPENVDILLTHSPPRDWETALDVTSHGMHAGCAELGRRLACGECSPWMHVFGHIHEGWGWAARSPEEVEQLARTTRLEEGARKKTRGREGKGRKSGGKGSWRSANGDGKAYQWSKAGQKDDLVDLLDGLQVTSPSPDTAPAPGTDTEAKCVSTPTPRWRLSVNAALGSNMRGNGKGIRAPIVVDWREEEIEDWEMRGRQDAENQEAEDVERFG